MPVRPLLRPDSSGLARLRAGLVLVALGLCGGGAKCQAGPTTTPRPGEPSVLDERPRDPQVQAAWDRLQAARAEDPGSDEVRVIAEQILAGDPPLSMRLAALRAKAEHAYLAGADPLAIATAEEGLALVTGGPEQDALVLVDLARIRLRALVRGGDPSIALSALDEPLVHARGGLPPVEEHGLRAVGLDRNGDLAGALVELAAWRELLPDGDPTALWVEQRIALLGEGLAPDGLAALVTRMPPSAGRACLAARQGEPVAPGLPPWVASCASASGGIGILLPRTGPLSAFADEHLAAALATVEVVTVDGPAPALMWKDAGSSTKSALSGARSLLAEGARVLVGPIGAKSVKAVADDVGGRAAVVVPGEGSGSASGVAASLERRIAVLVGVAEATKRERLVVLAPDNAYGRRAIAAVEAKAKGTGMELVVRTYPPATTSFAPHVNPVMAALRGESAVLVPDTFTRAELVIRQLARAGRMPAREDVPGVMVLTTAEGVDPEPLARARDVLDGVWVVPAAARGPEVAPFEDAYARLQGEAPGDQALLVFLALQQAITGHPGPGAGKATLTRVKGGALVVQSSPGKG
ncbi:MAG: ABC transporter substrate-binding protein [Myxococcales bacterium]|nr:ABC transporter substrate-binding protein [Myxococcales bacterium]MCB9712735.1 ABC transporter substrate-binding protein [Myxococcales bacterium]